MPGTGIVLNSRLGRGAYLIERDPNEVRARRHPMHTLNVWMVGDRDRPALIGGTPGGDGQVRWNMQLISHLVDHACTPQEAVQAPRTTVHPGSDADVIGSPLRLRAKDRFGTDVLAALATAGFPLDTLPPYGSGGLAQVITRRRDGVLFGGSDPRGEGRALGL